MNPATKKTLQIVTIAIISLFVLGIISFTLVFSLMTYGMQEENYADWRCFDHHLDYLDSSYNTTENSVEVNEYSTYDAYYRTIKSENEGKFAAARLKRTAIIFAGYYGPFVIQAPENRISVIDDWTISSLGF